MNLLFTVDRNYLPILCTCLRSVFRFPCPEGYHIYLMHSDLTEEDGQALRRLCPGGAEVTLVTMDSALVEDFPVTSRYPRQMYYRILAARFLPEGLDRVLYLDRTLWSSTLWRNFIIWISRGISWRPAPM